MPRLTVRRPVAIAAALVAVALVAVGVASRPSAAPPQSSTPLAGPMAEPQDWMNRQRAFPAETVEFGAFERAADQAKLLEASTAAQEPELAAQQWQLAGPTNVGARIIDVAVDPTAEDTVYAAAASGGVWKSTDAGINWAPAWPDDLTQAMGALAITPDGTLFAGTGEAGPGGGSLTFGGTGLYRSTDGAATWERVGLETSGAFGRIMVDPQDPNTIFAAASGHLYIPGGERGLYRSTDGGDTWERVLEGANPTTGATDLAIDPSNPDRIFTTMWDHIRTPGLRVYGGVGSGVFASEDGGDTWERVENGLPPSSPDVGRIGVAIAPSDPDLVYVTVIGTDGRYDDLYNSVDGGESFLPVPESPLVGQSQSSFGWWFGRIFVDPVLPTHIFIPGVQLVESYDGGRTAAIDALVHADQHSMAWDPNVEERVYLGNDGGMYRSDRNGLVTTYVAAEYQPWTQSYTADVSQTDPARLVTGLQDNGTFTNYAQPDGEPGPDQWDNYNGGDGLETIIDPTNPLILYGCSQYGNCVRSENGGTTTSRLGANNSASGRRNWQTPLELDPSNPEVVYYAGNVVDRSTDRGRTFTQISPDLTKMEDIDPDYPFGTISALGIGTDRPEVLYAGTDDGLLWTTKDLGANWTQLEDPALPGIYVTSIEVDPDNADVAYVTYSGFRQGDDTPHVLATSDGGETWVNRSADLPAAPVNDLLIAGEDLVVATDVGVFVQRTGSEGWLRVGDGLPLAPVMDVVWHAPTRQLTAATFGRSVWNLTLPEAPPGSPGQPGEPTPAPTETPTDTPTSQPTPAPAPTDEPGQRDRTVDRLGSTGRVETAVEVSRSTFEPGVGVVYVATGGDFPDALAGGAAAALQRGPVLLTGRDDLPDATRSELERLQPERIVVLGGTAAVSDSVATELDGLGPTDRVAGADRFETAGRLAQLEFVERASVAYVATGGAFPDALSGAVAAGREGAPVLLTGADDVPSATLSALDALRPTRIVLLGGTAAASEAVESRLAQIAPVERLAGADRFSTAAAVASTFPAPTDVVYAATGGDFPDALTVAPAAARTSSPLLLVGRDDVPQPARTELDRLAPQQVVVVGGPSAVSDGVVEQLRR